MTAPKLDPRPARNLTSRECCKVLGGLIGGIRSAHVIPPDALRGAIGLLCDEDAIWRLMTPGDIRTMLGAFPQPSGDLPASVEWVTAMGSLLGLAGSLVEIGGKKNARTAFRWWAERDDAWELIA